MMSYFLGEITFEQFVAWKMSWKYWLDETKTRCNTRIMTKNSLNWFKGVRWLMKVEWLEDKLNTQLFRYENPDRCHIQRWNVNYYHKYKCKNIPLSLNFPITKEEFLFFIFMISKRVTNTRWSSSSDESILTCFTNLRKEGFGPR